MIGEKDTLYGPSDNLIEGWKMALRAGVLATHFVCEDETHFEALKSQGKIILDESTGEWIKISTGLPIWVAKHS